MIQNKRKLNLGSGPAGIRSWENVDWGLLPILGKWRLNNFFCILGLLDTTYNVHWPEIRLVDIRRKLPYGNGQIDYIYCSHVLEHFLPTETEKILRECKRILKKSGVLRIVLPDLDKLIEKFRDADEFNNEMFGYEKNSYKTFLGKVKEKFIRPHQWMYNKSSFVKLIKRCGFSKIEILEFRKGKCPDIELLDQVAYKDTSFFIELGQK